MPTSPDIRAATETEEVLPPATGKTMFGVPCKDCGDPATEYVDQKVTSSIWGVMSLPCIPVCPPCKLRRALKKG